MVEDVKVSFARRDMRNTGLLKAVGGKFSAMSRRMICAILQRPLGSHPRTHRRRNSLGRNKRIQENLGLFNPFNQRLIRLQQSPDQSPPRNTLPRATFTTTLAHPHRTYSRM